MCLCDLFVMHCVTLSVVGAAFLCGLFVIVYDMWNVCVCCLQLIV